VRVLDLGAVIAGPYAGSLLAELGADVVKVEPPTGDSFRGPGFSAYNKGQRSLAIDLRRPQGRDAFLALARHADVVIDNYRPGVLARLGLDRDALAAVNPAIVSMSSTGFGDHGPLGEEAGFDPVLQAMSGMMRAQGGDDRPVFFSVPVNDVTTAASVALGVSAAVLHARRTGEGQ
jgi:crotonobetainyl-CoA:carnitine CoA-transferase CaiB-like acyl-CoA transferase